MDGPAADGLEPLMMGVEASGAIRVRTWDSSWSEGVPVGLAGVQAVECKQERLVQSGSRAAYSFVVAAQPPPSDRLFRTKVPLRLPARG